MAFKTIKPKGKFDPKVFIDKFTEAMEYIVDEFAESYRQSYKTWQHKPYFQSKVYSTSDEIIGMTWTTGQPSKSNPYPWIERGTKVRYALLSPDWQSQTKPGKLVSSPGRGKVILVSRAHPRPGIKARNFTSIVKKNALKSFPRRMEGALNSAVKASGHYIKI
jgi:hypothetical protein